MSAVEIGERQFRGHKETVVPGWGMAGHGFIGAAQTAWKLKRSLVGYRTDRANAEVAG
jgi:hypothetical protein